MRDADTMSCSFFYWTHILLIPLAGVCLILALRLATRRPLNYLYTAITACIFGLTTIPPLTYILTENRYIVEDVVFEIPVIGKVSLWLNPYSAIYALFTSIILTCVAVYSLAYMEHRLEELGLRPDLSTYYILYILYGLGLLGIVYSSNLIVMFVFLELAVVTSFLLIMLYGYGERFRIALMYFVWSQIASLTLLCGLILLLLHPDVGTVYVLDYLKKSIRISEFLPFILVLIGCLVKMGTLLVHFWLPWAHAEAPSPISAILSPVHIGLMSYVLIEITHTVLRPVLEQVQLYVMLYSVATMVYGAVMALAETDFKRFLAYSSISHMGSLLLCVALPTQLGEIAAALVFTAHALAKAVLFMTSGYLIYRTGIRDMTRLGGLYGLMTSSAIVAIIGFISLAGVFNIGLIAKIYMTQVFIKIVATRLGFGELGVFCILVYIAALVLTVAYCFYALKRIYFGPARPIRVLPYTVLTMEIPTGILAILTIVLLLPPVLEVVLSKASAWAFTT